MYPLSYSPFLKSLVAANVTGCNNVTYRYDQISADLSTEIITSVLRTVPHKLFQNLAGISVVPSFRLGTESVHEC